MQHLLRLLNLPNRHTEQSSPGNASPLKNITPSKKQLAFNIHEPPHHRLNYSVQHHLNHAQNKIKLRIKGISQSQRVPCDLDSNSSIRISKNTFKIHHHPLAKSEHIINGKPNDNPSESNAISHRNSKKLTTIALNPEFDEKSIFSRKRNVSPIKSQIKVESDVRERKSLESGKMRAKKCKMLKLIGTGCKIHEAYGLPSKKAIEEESFRTLQQ